MIIGIGTDMIEVKRIRDVMERDFGFREKIFTGGEISYCDKMKNKYQYYAARYAAKEAFMKALGTGWRFGIAFSDIDIYHDELGKPFIRLSGKSQELAAKAGVSQIHVTLSHLKEIAMSTVLLEGPSN